MESPCSDLFWGNLGWDYHYHMTLPAQNCNIAGTVGLMLVERMVHKAIMPLSDDNACL